MAAAPSCHLAISDRLEELEKDKAKLSEQLLQQQKESMVREINLLRKRSVYLL
jgi:Mg2+ and Co2+ transporter CorA